MEMMTRSMTYSLLNFTILLQIVPLAHSILFSLKLFEIGTFSYSVKCLKLCKMKHWFCLDPAHKAEYKLSNMHTQCHC